MREGIPVDVSDVGGFTALHRATEYNRTDVIKRLLHEGAELNRETDGYKDTPLHLAALYNKTEAVRLLFDNGADINLKNYDNKTPLDVAHERSAVKSLLLQLQQSPP